VLSNGTGQMHPCVFIRTALRVYLFDCPEGISRFVNSFRIKPSMIRDIFITAANWDCMGGVASVMLAKSENHDVIEVRYSYDSRERGLCKCRSCNCTGRRS
jgi:ribonuclease BN (tRNA processing enzyme)